MSEKPPRADSNRTRQRAAILARARGCVWWNDCWDECCEAGKNAIVEGKLDDGERRALRGGS